jgi:hypothetical protein
VVFKSGGSDKELVACKVLRVERDGFVMKLCLTVIHVINTTG